MRMTGFVRLDKVGIFGKSARVEPQWQAVPMGQGTDGLDIGQGHGLSGGRIIGNAIRSVRLQQVFNGRHVHVSLEGIGNPQVFDGKRFGQVLGKAIDGFNTIDMSMGLGRVKKAIRRNQVVIV
eukprot:scaffold11079_cov92-Amphora_coffeaeformis.AAC.5